jgi:hypothetical protein
MGKASRQRRTQQNGATALCRLGDERSRTVATLLVSRPPRPGSDSLSQSAGSSPRRLPADAVLPRPGLRDSRHRYVEGGDSIPYE